MIELSRDAVAVVYDDTLGSDLGFFDFLNQLKIDSDFFYPIDTWTGFYWGEGLEIACGLNFILVFWLTILT